MFFFDFREFSSPLDDLHFRPTSGFKTTDCIYSELCLQVENIVAAEYELEHLLLEGHCFDVSSGQPPRGLQFTLGTSSEPVIVDTIVMANLVRDG